VNFFVTEIKLYIFLYVFSIKKEICIINQQDATLAILCLLTTTSTLYMFRPHFESIIRGTINFNSSHWCLS